MQGIASILAKAQMADPDRFAVVEGLIVDAKRCRRSDKGLSVVPVCHGYL
jgi:hypothetical protein